MYISRYLQRGPYVCASCTRSKSVPSTPFSLINGSSRLGRSYSVAPETSLRSRKTPTNLESQTRRHSYSTAHSSRGPLRVAIIGSGPAGFYTAHRLLNKFQDAVVDMYEQLPVPFGLARFGVAPDHPEVKNCQDTFEEVAKLPRFNYVGNVRVGHDIGLLEMKPHYDAMLFSYGASEDRKLGIPGEDLPGVYSAREFVGWYNGLPQFQGLEPELQAGEQAVVIGQGNVALDVARILLTPVDALRHTDITEQAIQTLSESRIRSVRVVGRRGPVQAAFTVKEARELMHIPSVAFEPIDPSFYPPDIKKLPRVQKRIAEVLFKGSKTTIGVSRKSWALDFLKAPKSFDADASHLTSITLAQQQFAVDADPFSPSARISTTDEETWLEASSAFRSVGYKSTALPGLSDLGVPFDAKLGIVPNDIYGRVITPSAGPGNLTAGQVNGLYCAGWVKLGPTGVIASTMQDAFTTADIIVQDWQAQVPFLNDFHGNNEGTRLGWAGIKEKVIAKGIRPLSWDDWKRIDQAERARGKRLGKEREKFPSVAEMLKVLDA